MVRLKFLLLIPICCVVSGPALAGGTLSMFIPNVTNMCITQTGQNFGDATRISVAKTLAAGASCKSQMANSAACYNITAFTTDYVLARAVGPQITMSPSCSWICGTNTASTNCGTIAINSTSDGLPVELMEFNVDSDETSEASSDK